MSIKTNKLVSSSGDYEVPVGKISQFGMGQTWQAAELTDTGAVFTDGTPKYRAAGVTYTNDRDYPIDVSVTGDRNDAYTLSVFIDGELSKTTRESGTDTHRINLDIVVPPGSTYRYTLEAGSLYFWSELR